MLAYSAKDISLTVKVLWDKTKGRKIRKLFLPILRPLSVIGLAIFRLPGDGIQLAPVLPLGQVHLALFFFGNHKTEEYIMAVSFPQLDVYYIDFSEESKATVGKLDGLGKDDRGKV